MPPESHPRFNVDFQSSAFRPTDQGMGVIAEGGFHLSRFLRGKICNPQKKHVLEGVDRYREVKKKDLKGVFIPKSQDFR